MNFVIVVFSTLISLNALGSPVTFGCEINDGTAKAYVCANGAYSGSGNGRITILSQSGSTSINKVWVVSIVNSCKVIAEIPVSSDALGCNFQGR
ncbi:MAG: hypothetical protein EOP05_02025 [Proteobacteria bacterium]|nr:MAG: hypothetical protein EOP05_02025 [Pseudomonadota bacterium]